MHNGLRILILGDSTAEAEAITQMLSASGSSCDSKRVSSNEELIHALTHFSPEVVLCNSILKHLDPKEAFRLVKEFSPPTTAFLLLAESDHAETAVEWMKAGVDDYILKNKLSALTAAVHHAVSKKREIITDDPLKNIAENASDLMIIVDKKGHFVYASPSYAEATNHAPKPNADFLNDIHPGDRGHVMQVFKEVVETGLPKRSECRLQHNDQKFKFVESQWNAVSDENGKVRFVISVSRIITKRKRAEEALRENVKHFRALVENISDAISLINPYGIVLYTSRSTQRVLGYFPEEFVGRNAFDLIHPDDLSELMNHINVLRSKPGATTSLQFRIKHKDESWRWMEGVGNNLTHDPSVNSIVFNYRDITGRKEAEDALRQSDERFRALVEHSSDALTLIASDGTLLYSGPSSEQILGYSSGENMGKNVFQFIHADDGDRAKLIFRQLLHTPKQTVTMQLRLLHKNGSWRWMECVINNLLSEPSVKAIVINARDITDRKMADDALAEEKERLLVTLRSIGEGVITTNTERKIVLLNKTAEMITGWSQEKAYGQPVDAIIHLTNERSGGVFEHPVHKVLRTKTIAEMTNHVLLLTQSDSKRIITDNAAPIRDKDGQLIGVVMVFREITDQLKMENEILKSRKIESIGILAGGIAHDFNNILSAILGNISLAKMKLDAKNIEKALELLLRAERASERAKDLTQQLLTFSKGGAPVKKTANIGDLLKDSANFSAAGSNVRCDFLIPDDLWHVDIDAGQMSQVINNLVINARQAMPDGGTITIKAENLVVMASSREYAVNLKSGNFIKILIRDHGIGIPEENIQKIFDPYFTTKKTGNGLGLATSYSIIKNHDGAITLESKLGTGTTFYIYLPASRSEVQPKPIAIAKPIYANGKILVMDDEEVIREMAAAMLTDLGYDAHTAKDGAETIAMYEQSLNDGMPYDAVIMDLTIPAGMGGKETVKKLIELDPYVRTIVSSGYSNDPVMADHKKYGFISVLPKPYQLNDLARLLEHLLVEKY
jgi:PAS domain S-box-containing protein